MDMDKDDPAMLAKRLDDLEKQVNRLREIVKIALGLMARIAKQTAKDDTPAE